MRLKHQPKKLKSKHLVMRSLSVLALLTFIISTSGCTIGIKEKVRIVYVSRFKIPKELKGSLKIATNKRIPVTIEGEKDISTTMDLGGYYAVKAQDLKGLVDALNRR